jgi:hypothetical protein
MKKTMIVLLAMGILLAAGPALAQSAGQFTEVQGKVSVKRANGQVANVALKTQVFKGDVITTEKASKGTVLFKDGSVIRIGPATKLTITNHVYQEEKGVAQAAYEVASGTIMSVVGSIFGNNESEYKVKTPTSVSGVRGTMFIVHVQTNAQGQTTTQLVGVEGHVSFSGSSGGNFDVGAGQMSGAGPDGLATGPVAVDDAYMQQLLESITVGTRSVDERAGDVRGSGDLLPGAPIPEGSSILDLVTNPDLLNSADNPADLIYQEPPNAVELTINIQIGAP